MEKYYQFDDEIVSGRKVEVRISGIDLDPKAPGNALLIGSLAVTTITGEAKPSLHHCRIMI